MGLHDTLSDKRQSGLARRVVLAFLLAIFVLAVFVYAVGWDAVLRAIARTDVPIYAGAFVATTGCLVCRTIVWHRILSIVDRPRPYWLVGGVFLTAMFTKYVIPYGQVTSGVGVAAIVSRYYDAAYEEGLAGVVSADFINYVPYYTFGAIGGGYVILVHSPPLDSVRPYAVPVLALLVSIVIVLAILWRWRSIALEALLTVTTTLRRVATRMFDRNLKFLRREQVKQRFEGFYTTVDLVAHDRRESAIALGFAHLGWIGLAIALYITALAMNASIPFGMALFLVAIAKLGFVVPTPGGIGGVEFTLATALYLIAPVTFATATAVALLWRFSTYWYTMCLGGLTATAITLKDPLPPADE